MFRAGSALGELPNNGSEMSDAGGSRFTRLKRLKNSTRNCRVAGSRRIQGIVVTFRKAKSVFA